MEFLLLKKREKNPSTSHIHFLSLFESELGRGPLFWSSDPSGWLQAERGNFAGFLINIQPLSCASLGHLVVNVYSLVQDMPEISLTLRLMTKTAE